MPLRKQLETRRGFLKSVAATSSLLTCPLILRADDKSTPLNVAFIGVGGRGRGNLEVVAGDSAVKVVALCDVDGAHLNRAAMDFPSARTYRDFRDLYEDASDIDAVVVSTCEHTHAYATLPALQMGKHVYCEKPLTHNVAEARQITQAAAKSSVVTQMGTQIHAGANYRRVVELIQSGAIGDVSEVHVWVSRAWGLQSEQDAKAHGDLLFIDNRPTEEMTPPESLDWKLWLGPAEYRPFHTCYLPGPRWYRWWDFGNGTMSDLGSHWIDLPFWALQLDAPTSVEAHGDAPHPEIAPASMIAHYSYAARGSRPACRVSWYQGIHKPQVWTVGDIPNWDSGVLFVGSEGNLLADYGRHLLLPEEKFVDFKRPEPFIADSPGHHQEWLRAIRTGSETGSPFSYAGPLTEANHLGNVAFRAGGKIQWDAANMRIANDESANRFLSRANVTPGWSL
jgi:predicted dehydrogenase